MCSCIILWLPYKYILNSLPVLFVLHTIWGCCFYFQLLLLPALLLYWTCRLICSFHLVVAGNMWFMVSVFDLFLCWKLISDRVQSMWQSLPPASIIVVGRMWSGGWRCQPQTERCIHSPNLADFSDPQRLHTCAATGWGCEDRAVNLPSKTTSRRRERKNDFYVYFQTRPFHLRSTSLLVLTAKFRDSVISPPGNGPISLWNQIDFGKTFLV